MKVREENKGRNSPRFSQAVLNKSNIPDLEIPKVKAKVAIESIELALSEDQYHDLLDMLHRVTQYQRHLQTLPFKPSSSPLSDPVGWWKFTGTLPTYPLCHSNPP